MTSQLYVQGPFSKFMVLDFRGMILEENRSRRLKIYSVGSCKNDLCLGYCACVMLQRSVLKIPKHKGVDLRRTIMEYNDLHIMEAHDIGCSKIYLCLRDWHTLPSLEFGSPNFDI